MPTRHNSSAVFIGRFSVAFHRMHIQLFILIKICLCNGFFIMELTIIYCWNIMKRIKLFT